VKGIDYSSSLKALISSILIGLFWALVPLFGWSEYAFEGAMISCSVEWNKKTPSIISYNIFIFIFIFLLPMSVFIFTNARILIIVSFFFIQYFYSTFKILLFNR
jgi:hypothetical protein